MSWTDGATAEIEDVELSWGQGAQGRAKPVVRRTPAVWQERDGAWHASMGAWAVRVVRSPVSHETWEWSGFAARPRSGPRALRCTGFGRRDAAQHDAETSLAALA
jgi:hypothetical protein